ncbi:hypothetical protein V1512DRAFT_258353 [Lipomyces arxii]|uniref:uncharacterized protein n=1 Tax=Lipomyces arxii TaxID=56418 RepID=UPI0034CDA456
MSSYYKSSRLGSRHNTTTLRGDAPSFIPHASAAAVDVPKTLSRSDSTSSLISVFKSIGRRQRRPSNVSDVAEVISNPPAAPPSRARHEEPMFKQIERTTSSVSLFMPKIRSQQDGSDLRSDALQRRRKLATGFIKRAFTDQQPSVQEKDSDASSIKSTSSRFRSFSHRFRRTSVVEENDEDEEEDDVVPVLVAPVVRRKASASRLRGKKVYGDDPETSMQLFKALQSTDDLSQSNFYASQRRPQPQYWAGSSASLAQLVDSVDRKTSAGSSISNTSDVSTTEYASSVTTVDSSPDFGSRSGTSATVSGSGVCWIGEGGSSTRAGRVWDLFNDESDDEDRDAFVVPRLRSRTSTVTLDGHRHTLSAETVVSIKSVRSARSSGHDWRVELEKENVRVAGTASTRSSRSFRNSGHDWI